MIPEGPVPQDAQAFIASLDEVDLSRFRVVGTYTRYDEAVRNALQDARQKILAGFEPPGRKRENHLIWAAPGTGKTYFVQQIAVYLPSGIRYHELNLAKCTESEFWSGLEALNGQEAYLCLVDEIDAKPQEPWPYEVLLPYLDAAAERGARVVIVLAGSSGTSIHDIKQRIAARPKGTDLLSRIPTGHEYEIGPMSLGDRILIVLSQLRQAGRERGREIRAVEKFGLYYIALNEELANARQLREVAVRAVERVPRTDDRVKYDHLFMPGDPDNKAFWLQALPATEHLANTFVTLTSDGIGITATSKGGSIETRPRTNLPRQMTSFVGREREIAEVKQLLPTTALLTLTGAGGCGKTRLALRVAADLFDAYPDGVWVVDLASLSAPSLVPNTVAAVLGVAEQPGRSLVETLKDYLRPRSLLLVLDNCEHIVTACAEIADVLLRMCPGLRILATSREPLGILGETLWRVPSLSVPDRSLSPSFEDLTQCDAVRLLVDRIVSHQPGFAVTPTNAGAVARLCTQLDGIPLAIELAAARVRVLSVEQIAARLGDRFRLLAGGGRTVLHRHQTLRAALDWSYDLLSKNERTVLGRLSVFSGGWTLEAVESVCAGGTIETADILDLLSQLVDKSLVGVSRTDGDTRYGVLGMVRQYAYEKLAAGGGAEDLRCRHCRWYLSLVEEAGPRWGGPAMPEWIERLEREHDNFRAALEWTISESGNREFGLRLAVALVRFWEMRGYFSEGRGWLEALIAGSEAAALLRAAAFNAAGILAYRQGDYPRVSVLCSEALALCEAHGDHRGAGRALHFLAHLMQARGDYTGATEMMERSVALHRAVGDAADLANSVDCLGEIARSAGDDAKARVQTEEALALYRELGHVRGQAHALHNLAYIRLHEGDAVAARALFRESLVLVKQLGSIRDQVFAIAGLACASLADREETRVTRLLGAAAAALTTFEVQLEPAEGTEFQRAVEAMRAQLDPASFAATWAEGRAMTLEQAIEYALIGEAN